VSATAGATAYATAESDGARGRAAASDEAALDGTAAEEASTGATPCAHNVRPQLSATASNAQPDAYDTGARPEAARKENGERGVDKNDTYVCYLGRTTPRNRSRQNGGVILSETILRAASAVATSSIRGSG
jgi:hypothetical protein